VDKSLKRCGDALKSCCPHYCYFGRKLTRIVDRFVTYNTFILGAVAEKQVKLR
jgi:hypothetical protein